MGCLTTPTRPAHISRELIFSINFFLQWCWWVGRPQHPPPPHLPGSHQAFLYSPGLSGFRRTARKFSENVFTWSDFGGFPALDVSLSGTPLSPLSPLSSLRLQRKPAGVHRVWCLDLFCEASHVTGFFEIFHSWSRAALTTADRPGVEMLPRQRISKQRFGWQRRRRDLASFSSGRP